MINDQPTRASVLADLGEQYVREYDRGWRYGARDTADPSYPDRIGASVAWREGYDDRCCGADKWSAARCSATPPPADAARDASRAAVLACARDLGWSPEPSYDRPGRLEGSSDRELTDALDMITVGGMADATGGEIDAPTGFFARVDRYIVRGDSQGFVWHETYPSADEAESAFETIDADYCDWIDADPNVI